MRYKKTPEAIQNRAAAAAGSMRYGPGSFLYDISTLKAASKKSDTMSGPDEMMCSTAYLMSFRAIT